MIAVFAIAAIPIVYALNTIDTGFRSDPGTTVTIDAPPPPGDVCTKINNTSAKSYFIPTKTPSEWTDFKNNLPLSVSLESCVVAPLCPAAEGTNFAGYTTATYTGGMGGVAAADALCAAEFPESRMANSTELKCVAPSQGAWLRDQPISQLTPWSDAHCYSWTSSNYSASFNPFGVIAGPPNASGSCLMSQPLPGGNCARVSTCDISRSIACAYDEDYIIIISSDTSDYNLATAIGNPVTAKKIRLTINPGVVVSSTNTGSPAFDTGSLPGGSTLKIVNNGTIVGKGGDGGHGADGAFTGTPYAFIGEAGFPGGNAMSISIPVVVDNTNGYIYGGGGGGGGGGSYKWAGTGGGGGGGAGRIAGVGGLPGGSSGNPFSKKGQDGSTTGGLGGVGGVLHGSGCYSPDGGKGGDYGQPGVIGGSAASCNAGDAGGTFGQPGKAINTNGNGITWLGTGNNGTQVKGAVN